MNKNYVDIPVPISFPGAKNVYEPLEWAKKNCSSYITNDAVQREGIYYYRFYFGNEKDMTMFILRWS